MTNKTNSFGFALLALLIFLQIFILLGTFGLITATTTFSEARHAWKRQYHLNLAQQLFHHIALLDVSSYSYCMLEPIPSDQFIQKEANWWEKIGCGGKVAKIHYSYVIEPLGNDACATFNMSNNQLVIATYYRITLAILDIKNQDTKIIVQRTIAIPTESREICAENKRIIAIGYQSMRILK